MAAPKSLKPVLNESQLRPIARKKIVISSDDFSGPKAQACRGLQRLCRADKLRRIGVDRYLLGGSCSTAVPSRIFPWWGSKRRLVAEIVSVLRQELERSGCERVVSPFTGTGVVEGTLKALGLRIRCFDACSQVCAMHRALATTRGRELAAARFARELLKLREDLAHYRSLQQTLRAAPTAASAVRWNLGLRTSFMGRMTQKSRPIAARVEKLRVKSVCKAFLKHRGVRCRQNDVFTLLPRTGARDLLFLDPPYLLEKPEAQYSAGDFDLAAHAKLAVALSGRHFVLCHREDPLLERLYESWCTIVRLPAIMNISRAGRSANEILVIGRGAACRL